MNLFDLLNANNYFCVNRKLAQEIGLETAVFLSEIVDKHAYFESNEMLKNGWFYLTIETAEERTSLSRRQQDSAIEALKKLGFIDSKQMGLPAKRHFFLFKEKITEWLFRTNKDGDSSKLEWRKTPTRSGENEQPTPIYKRPNKKTYTSLVPPVGETTDSVSSKEKKELPSEAYEIAEAIWKHVHKIHPNHKAPNIEEWARTIEICHRIDHRAWEDIRLVLRFATEIDPFWAKTMQSADSLRRNFDKISLKMKPVETEGSRIEINREFAFKIKNLLAKKGQEHLLIVHAKSVQRQNGDSTSLDLPPETFESILVNWFSLRVK